MQYIYALFKNPFLMTGLTSWGIAQILKTVIFAVINKGMDFRRLIGDGGMPSGHSATVSSLAAISFLVYGPASFEFAVCALLAVIVCHDAMGVRLETGKQAVVLNELIQSFSVFATEKLPEVKLKEFVGHTPVQVLAGILIGIANAVGMYFLWFR